MCAYMIAACRPRRPIGTPIQPYDQDDKRRVSNWEFIPNIMDRSHAMRFHAESCAVLRCVPLSTWLYTAPCCTILCLLVLTTTVHWYITDRSQLIANLKFTNVNARFFGKQQAHICDNYKTYSTVNSKESLNTQQTLTKMNNVLRFLDNKLASSVATTMITTAREEEYDGLYTTLKPFE